MDRTLPSRTYSFASIADCNVTDGVLAATSTVTASSQLTTGDLSGGSILTGGVLKPPRMLTITRSLATGAYTTDPIVITGKRGGSTATASMTQSDADGGDIVRSGILFDSISTVDVPAMGGTSGSYSIGVEDVGCVAGDRLMGAKMAIAGPSALTVAYAEDGTETDTIEADGAPQPGGYRRIATANMTQGFTVYFP
jgi:hypothetical protein